MADKIQIRRGNESRLPQLDNGELGLASDTKDVYIGTPTGNQLVGGKKVQDQFDSVNEQLAQTEKKKETDIINVMYPPPPMVGAKGDGETDDTITLQNIFNSGYSHFYLPPKTFKTTTTISIDNPNVHVIEGGGNQQSVISLQGNPNKNILTFSSNRQFIILKNFNLGHDTKGTGHGINFGENISNLYVEMVKVSNCFHGFYSTYTSFLQTYSNCVAQNCDVGFYVNGRNSSGTGSGTTIKFDKCYTNACVKGFRTNFVQEAVYEDCTVDNFTTYGIESTDCAITHIKTLHTENNSNLQALVRVSGGYADILTIDGLLIGATNKPSGVAYAVLVENPSLNCKVDISGLTGSGNSNLCPIRVVETAEGNGTYLFYNIKKDGFTYPNPSLSLQNGKFYELYQGTQTTVGATGSASVLPTNPVGYMKMKINGSEYVVPYYNA
jgi:hypothetical protein